MCIMSSCLARHSQNQYKTLIGTKSNYASYAIRRHVEILYNNAAKRFCELANVCIYTWNGVLVDMRMIWMMVARILSPLFVLDLFEHG